MEVFQANGDMEWHKTTTESVTEPWDELLRDRLEDNIIKVTGRKPEQRRFLVGGVKHVCG